jgi:transcriptional regulator
MRRPRHIPGRRPNPLRDLMNEQLRSHETARSIQRAEQLRAELPAMIESQVGEQIQKLEDKLVKEFQEMGQKVVEESTTIIHEQLNERIETLEQISAMQSTTLGNLRDSSREAEAKVSTVVNSIEKTLSNAVPGGFQLEPSAYAQPMVTAPVTGLVKAESAEVEDMKSKYGFCPYCTSTNIRRSNRSGWMEELLRLFFIAPFRCRACRKKFYRF